MAKIPALDTENGEKFKKYFVDTYLNETSTFDHAIWNYFSTDGERTNNRVEGDNKKINSYCGAANPIIDKVVSLFLTYNVTATIKYTNAKLPSAKDEYQAPQIRDRETCFRQARKMLHQNMISLPDYW
jgi:hypothetical protein